MWGGGWTKAGNLLPESHPVDGLANEKTKKLHSVPGVRVKKYIQKLFIYTYITSVQYFQAKYICQNFQLCATRVKRCLRQQNKAIVN